MKGFWKGPLSALGSMDTPPLGTVSVAELRAWISSGDTLLVDVREAEAHERHRVPGAVSFPLSSFPLRLATAPGDKRVVFHCQSGARTRLAARRLADSTALPAYALAGGLDGWDRSGGVP